MNVVWSRYIVLMVGIGLVGMNARGANPVQPAQAASGAAESAKLPAEVNKQSGTMPATETAKPAVEINK